MAIFPFPLIPRFKKIKKLSSDPRSTIKKWMFEKKTTKMIDPIKKKRKTIDDKKCQFNKLQKLLIQIMDKSDEIIDHLDGIADLEKMIIAEVKLRMSEIDKLRKELQLAEKKLNARVDELDTRTTKIRNTLREDMEEADEELHDKIDYVENLLRTQFTRADTTIKKTHKDYETFDEQRFDTHIDKFDDFKKFDEQRFDTHVDEYGRHLKDYKDIEDFAMGHRHQQYGYGHRRSNRRYTYPPYTGVRNIPTQSEVAQTNEDTRRGGKLKRGGKAISEKDRLINEILKLQNNT